MMRITNLADYSLILMSQLSHDTDSLHSAISLSEKTGVPVPTVSKLLGCLARNNLLTSQRGFNGGFRLSRSANDISIAEIIEAVDGPIALTACAEEDNDCDMLKVCTMRTHWQAINNAVKSALQGITLYEISSAPNPENFLKGFSINTPRSNL